MTQVAAEVAGDVIEVGVRDNSSVRKGQLMFRVDPEPYALAVRSAEANLAVALQGSRRVAGRCVVGTGAASEASGRPHANRKLNRIVTDLVDKNALAQTQEIRSTSEVGKTQADLARAEAELIKARANLGAPGYHNPKVRQALAALEQARLDLRNTRVIAPADGTVTNLRLATGQYVAPGQPLLSFLESGPQWISADLRENQLGNVKPGQKVLVAFDIRPGKLYEGTVHSIASGISQGDEAPTGQMSTVQAPKGWVREPQRFPVRILVVPDDGEKMDFPFGRSGAQANVIVFTEDESILNPVGRLWIKLVALLSYLQ